MPRQTWHFGRAIGRAHHFDSMAVKETGEYPSSLLPADIDREWFESHRRVHTVRGLILDEEIRAAIGMFVGEAAGLATLFNSNKATADQLVSRAIDHLDRAQELVAARIRGIYEGKVTTV